jgi:O-antigen ligase
MRKLAFWLSLLFVLTIPWEGVIEHAVLGSVSRMVGFVMAACWCASVLTTLRLRKLGFFHVLLCLFVALNAASLFWTASPERTMTQIMTWFELLLMSFIFWDLYTERSSVMVALQMYIFGAYMVACNTLLNYVAGTAFYYERFSAVNTHPDDLGIILALGLPVASYLAAFLPVNRFRFLRVVNITFVGAALVGIALSGTRTALVAVLPGILFGLALMLRLRRSAMIGVMVLLIAAASVVVPRIPEASVARLGTTAAEVRSGDLNGRVELWSEGLESFRRHALLGVGGNMFRSINIEGKVAHNTFLSVLVELGILGFLLCAVMLINVGAQALNQPTWDRRLWLCILATWAIGASMLTWEHRKPTWLFLNLIVASAAALHVRENAATFPEVVGPDTTCVESEDSVEAGDHGTLTDPSFAVGPHHPSLRRGVC